MPLFPKIYEGPAVSVIAVCIIAASFNVDATDAVIPDPLEAGWKGEPVCEKLQENDTVRALRCTFPPGIGHEKHYHSANFGYAISGGRVRITDASGVREVDLSTGSSFTSEGTEWHEILNIGDTTIVYLIVEPK